MANTGIDKGKKEPPKEQPPPVEQPLTESAPETPRKKAHKPKLSKAERKRRRLLEAIELQKRLMKEQLLREIAMTKKNEIRGREKFEGLCKDIKLKEFQEEIKVWGKKTQDLMQSKDEHITKLMKNIDETHEMHERNLIQHLDHLEYLTNCHNTLRQSATNTFEMHATQMISDFINEVSRSFGIQDRIKYNMENMVHASNVVAKNRLKKNYKNYMEGKFTGVCMEIERRYIFRDQTVKHMRTLQDQLIRWIKQLEGDIVDMQKADKYIYYMKRQQNYVKESTRLSELEKQSRDAIAALEQELFEIETSSVNQINSLKLEHEYFLNVRSMIKGSIMMNKRMIYEKLMLDSSESYRTIKRLKEIVRNGELLLGLAACCRKYKTEREKAVSLNPMNIDPVEEDEYVFKLSIDTDKLIDLPPEQLGEEMAVLQHFWKSCSNVRFHNLMLTAEKIRLEEENEQFRNIFRSLHKSDDVAYILESLQIKQLKIYEMC